MPTIAYSLLTEADHDPGSEPFATRLRRAPTSLLTQIVDLYLLASDRHIARACVARERWFLILDEIDRRRRAGTAA